ncbi:MAG: YcaO-like family protein [Parcubacteria group bacterium]|jgi:ribosomal protein S12 methylthiotransferase accessory factor
MRLRLAISATDLIKKISKKGNSHKFLKISLAFLENHFGSQILLDVPSGLQDFQPDSFSALGVASKLKSLGFIQKVMPQEKLPDEPFAYRFYVGSMENAHGEGIDFFSEEKAIWKALAEAIERFLWYTSEDFYVSTLVKAPLSKLKGKALNITSLIGFSQEQKKQFPIISYDKNSVFGWLKTHSLTNEEVWCPAQLFSSHYTRHHVKTLRESTKEEPMLRWAITTGLATGRCLEEATTKGILEIIERDAFMISYLNQISPPVIDLEYLSKQDEGIASILKKFRRYNLEVSLIQLPSDFPVFIIAATIIDRTGIGPAFSIGASADFNLRTCILDALSESLATRLATRDKYRHRQEINIAEMNREGRLIYWANPANLPKIEFITNGPKLNINLEKNFFQIEEDFDYKTYYAAKLAILTNKLGELKYKGYVAELTARSIEKLGLRSVQVVIPKLQPMHLNESIPYFSGPRLKNIPRQFNYSPKEPVNQEPHPFP